MNIQFFIEQIYKGEIRKTGAPYTSHLYHVRNILQNAGVHEEYILDAALLHDILEDTNYTKEYLTFRFGYKIAELVQVLSKIHHWNTAYCRMKSNLELMENSWRQYPEAIIIKMADRLHNLQTINGFDLAKKKQYIEETESLLLPLFRRFLFENNLGALHAPTQILLSQIENEVRTIEHQLSLLKSNKTLTATARKHG